MRVSLSVCLSVCMSVCLCVCPPVLTFVRQPGTSVKADKESLFVSLYNNNNNLRLNSLWNGTVQKSFRLRRSQTAARLLASQWPQVTFIPNHSDLFPRTFRSRENYECRRLEYCQTLVRNDFVNSQESSPPSFRKRLEYRLNFPKEFHINHCNRSVFLRTSSMLECRHAKFM